MAFADIVEQVTSEKDEAKRQRAWEAGQQKVQSHGRNAKRVWTQQNGRAKHSRERCRSRHLDD